MDPKLILMIFLTAGSIYTVIWAWVIASSRKVEEYSSVEEKLTNLRHRLFYVILAGMIVVFLISIVYMPYEPIRIASVGKPQMTVNVIASMFIWNLSQYHVPTGVPIEFDVTSIDVNHGFGIFTPEGTLFAQVQAMPTYLNKLVVVFDKPGRYVIRCLEYCGNDHFGMESFIDVE